MCKFSNKCPSYILSCSRSKKKKTILDINKQFCLLLIVVNYAKLDLIDISLEDFNLSVEKLTKKLKTKKKPKVVIPVHLAGYPCDLKRFIH